MLKKFVLKFYFASIISAAQHLYEKREGSGSDPDPYLWLMDPESGP
jgi:hypothetical protein